MKGAVKAALESKGDGSEGALGDLIREIEPVVNPVLGEGKDVDGAMHDAVDATVRSRWPGPSNDLPSSPPLSGREIFWSRGPCNPCPPMR